MFDCLPSDIQQVYWKSTLNDLKVKLRLYLGNKQAEIVQNFQTLSTVVSLAFGKGKKKEKTEMPQTKEQMEAAFNSVFKAK